MTDEEMNVIQCARAWRHAMTTDNLMKVIGAIDALEAIQEAQAADSEAEDSAAVEHRSTDPAPASDPG